MALRVTQVVLEVLYQDLLEELETDIQFTESLTDDTAMQVTRQEIQVLLSEVIDLDLETTLDIAEVVADHSLMQVTRQEIQVLLSEIIDESLETVVEFTNEVVEFDPEILESIDSIINFQEVLQDADDREELETELVFENTVTDNFEPFSETTEFVVQNSFNYELDGEFFNSISDHVGFQNHIQITEDISLETELNIVTDIIEKTFVADHLEIIELLIGEIGFLISDHVNVQENLIANETILRSLTTELVFENTVAIDDPNLCVLTPIGKAVLTFSYPPDLPSLSVTLKNPEFNNTDTLSFERINRDTRGGTLQLFADPNWPKHQRFELNIIGLKQTQRDDLANFLSQTLGLPILIKDWEDVEWTGVIAEIPEFVQTGKDQYQVSLTLEVI